MNQSLFIENLAVGYGKDIIASNINLKLNPGNFYAILGLNGTGKTTFLKTLLGLIPAKGGSCHLDGHELLRLSEKQRSKLIAYVPQRYSDGKGITVLDMVTMGFNPHLSILESPKKEHIEKAERHLKKLNIYNLANLDFSNLSAGQQQMVVLCRAIVQSTPMLVMDEPDNSLDFSHKHQMLSLVKSLTKTENKITLVTIHDPNLALEYCDNLIVLNKGCYTMVSNSKSNKSSILYSLQSLYGNVTLLEHGNLFYMVKS